MSVYLDWAATTPPDQEILERANLTAISHFANPSSVHSAGKESLAVLESSRERCARALGVKSDTVVFTSGGTESDYLPMLALLQRPSRGTIAVSSIEHPAILEQARMLDAAGWKTIVIPADRDGFITADAVTRAIRDDTAYVAVMVVNNETGAIQPVAEIAAALKKHTEGKKRPHFHVDAVQAAGKIPLDLAGSFIDSAAVSAHKIRGPRGCGLLYLAHRIEPFVRGGGQEGGMRPGTENLAGIQALSLCLESSVNSIGSSPVADVMERLIRSVTALKGVSVIPESRQPADARFSPYIAQFTNDRLPGEVLVRSLSDRGFFISTGSACSAKKKTRHVLEAMRVEPRLRQNAFRVSIGTLTRTDEIDSFCAALESILSEF